MDSRRVKTTDWKEEGRSTLHGTTYRVTEQSFRNVYGESNGDPKKPVGRGRRRISVTSLEE